MLSRVAARAAILAAALLLLPSAAPSLGANPTARQAPDVSAKDVPHRAPPPSLRQLPGEDISVAIPIPAIPFADSGSTCGYANDYDEECPYGASLSPDVVYSYTPGSDRLAVISLCESDYDTKVYVYENDPSNLVACNDDACGESGWRSEIWTLTMISGQTYYIVIDGYGGDCGDYDLDIFEIIHEVIECPAGAVDEGEPECFDGYVDTFNSGCAGAPEPAFSPLFGTPDGELYHVCGTAGTFLTDGLQFRDTDWYEFTATEENTITFTGWADFPVRILLIDGNAGCDELPILANEEAGRFPDYATFTYTCAPGTYWFWIAPSDFVGIECGGQYVFSVEGLMAVPTPVPAQSWARLKSLYR